MSDTCFCESEPLGPSREDHRKELIDVLKQVYNGTDFFANRL